MKRPLPDELLSSPVFLLKRLGGAAKERSMDAFEENGVHPYHYAILTVLDAAQSDTQGAIADTLGYDRGQLVGLLDEMEESGLVERRRDPDDRRRQIVQMTAAGKKTLAKLRSMSRRLDEEFLAGLDPEQRRQLHGLLLLLAEVHVPQCSLAALDRAAIAG